MAANRLRFMRLGGSRDEGPRLIPLDDKQSDKASLLEYDLQLGDAALTPQPNKAEAKCAEYPLGRLPGQTFSTFFC